MLRKVIICKNLMSEKADCMRITNFRDLLHPNSPLAHNHNAVGYPYVEQNENCKRGDKFKTHIYFQMPCKSR